MTTFSKLSAFCLYSPSLTRHPLRAAPNSRSCPRTLACRLNRYHINPNLSWRDELLLANGGRASESRLQDDAFFWGAVDCRCVDNVRMLLADAGAGALVALSGMPEVGYVLFRHGLRHNPRSPRWFGRDRLVVTFESRWVVLLGVLLHLADFDSFQIEDLNMFRKQGTPTTEHVEDCAKAAGIQIASGPLSQGLADAVRLAFEEASLAKRFNKRDVFVVDHRTYYWVMGDGCKKASIVNEAASFAVHLKLHKLTVIYCNGEQDMSSQFEALGWYTFTIENVNENMTLFKDAILCAQNQTLKPTFIQIKTFKEKLHKKNAIQDFRKKIRWEDRGQFYIIPMVYREFNHQAELGRCLESEWNSNLQHYWRKYAHDAEELRFLINGGIPYGWEDPPVVL